MYIDRSAKETFEQIQAKTFKPIKTNHIGLGFTKDALWVKFEIKNNSNQSLIRYLTLNKASLDSIALYEKKDKSILQLDPYIQKNIIHPSFDISFEPNETKSFYLKVHTISSSHNFKLQLKDTQTLYQDEFFYQLIKTLFLGAMFGLIIYNLFLLFFMKESVYLYYVLYIFFLTIYYTAYSQMMNYITSYPQVYFAIYYIGLTNIFSLMFVKSFLQIKNRIHNYIITTIVISTLLLMLTSTSMNLITTLTIINIVFILYLCLYALYEKNDQIKYILLGWILMITGTFMQVFKTHGLWSMINTFPYFYEMMIFSEAVLFSAALASRLNKTNSLKKSLKTNTILIKELHHRVKNNMQFIILIYRLKLDKIMNPKLDQNLKEAEGTIQAMSKTYEILYQQEDLQTIDTKEYFESLILQMKQSFDTSDIHIDLNASTQLTMNQSIYSGIILNELMTNALKYAFPKNKGNIWISFKKERNKVEFTFKDDGIGFDDKTQNKDTFGLSFIEALVTDELHGHMEINSLSGVSVRVQF